MSSAILYVAIVAIWACVLIPRWLRRDSSIPAPVPVPVPGAVPAPVPAPVPAERAEVEAGVYSTADDEPHPAPRRRRLAVGAQRAVGAHPEVGAQEQRDGPAEDPAAPVDAAHRRVVSARRRLLLMLALLCIASGVLAGMKMAAWWVIVPPSVMLLGYMLLLRAAARADAERRKMAMHRVARAGTEAARTPTRRPAAPVASVASVASIAKAAEAKIISIPTGPEPTGEEIYDQYADAKLRAVGD